MNVVAAIVPLSAAAKEGMMRERNKRWAMPIAKLPASLRTAVEQQPTEGPIQEVVVYDISHLHTRSRRSMKFGKARTSQVQLLGPLIDLSHVEISYDPVTRSFTLANHSALQDVPLDTPSGDLDLKPGTTTTLAGPTTFTLHTYKFRLFPRDASDSKAADAEYTVDVTPVDVQSVNVKPSIEPFNVRPSVKHDVQPSVKHNVQPPVKHNVQPPVKHNIPPVNVKPTGIAADAAKRGVKRKIQDDLSEDEDAAINKYACVESLHLGPASRAAVVGLCALGIMQQFLR